MPVGFVQAQRAAVAAVHAQLGVREAGAAGTPRRGRAGARARDRARARGRRPRARRRSPVPSSQRSPSAAPASPSSSSSSCHSDGSWPSLPIVLARQRSSGWNSCPSISANASWISACTAASSRAASNAPQRHRAAAAARRRGRRAAGSRAAPARSRPRAAGRGALSLDPAANWRIVCRAALGGARLGPAPQQRADALALGVGMDDHDRVVAEQDRVAAGSRRRILPPRARRARAPRPAPPSRPAGPRA